MKHLPRKHHSELLFQANEAVSHIESDKNYSCFFLKNGQKIIMAYSLLVYQKALGTSFVRINRSHLINRNEIESIENNRVSTRTGMVFTISRRRKKLFFSFFVMFFLHFSFLMAQNVAEVNPQGTKGIVYSKGVGSTDISGNFRGGIVSEIPSTFPNTTGKTFAGVIGSTESNGGNLGVLGIASTNLTNSTFATGVVGTVNLRQGLGVGVSGNVFANSIASDVATGGEFSVTAHNNTNAGIQLIGMSTDVNSNFNTVSAFGYGTKTEILGNFGTNVYGNYSRINLGNTNTATAYGGYFQISSPSTTQAYGIYSTAGTGSNKYAAWLNGNVLVGSGPSTTSDVLEVVGSTTIKNNLSVNGNINIGSSGTLSKYLRVSTTMNVVCPANSFNTLTVTATGAAMGDNVILNYLQDIGSLIISQVWVSAANTVSVKVYNPTASSTFPTNYDVRVILTR